MKFDWDDGKNTSNFGKHGIWFEEAQTVWADPRSLEFYDPDHSDDDDRFIRIGYSTKDRVVVAVFCERDNATTIRIISARKATRKEVRDYERGV